MEATIVLAEDDADLRVLYAQWLRRAGHRVWEAADGAEALSAVMAYRPDLLLLDIWMPILNGLEVLEHLGRAALGVVDYWTKDLSLAELSARIESVLESPSPATESAVND